MLLTAQETFLTSSWKYCILISFSCRSDWEVSDKHRAVLMMGFFFCLGLGQALQRSFGGKQSFDSICHTDSLGKRWEELNRRFYIEPYGTHFYRFKAVKYWKLQVVNEVAIPGIYIYPPPHTCVL